MKKIFQFLVFLVIQIPLLPFTIIGFILVTYKEYRVSKKLDISVTTMGATPNKWLMHYFGTRTDETTVKFIKALPIESHYGMLATYGAAIIANRICGYRPSLGAIPEPGTETLITFQNPKTMEFDRSMERNLNRVDQVVVMGAGFDLRVLKYTVGKNVKVFELDLKNAQNLKLETMKKAGIDHDWITYIPVDFDHESWVEKLLASGFDKTKKTFFLIESVTAYLSEDVVRDTLKKVAEMSAVGSVVAQDFFSEEFIKRVQKLSATMRASNLFGIDMSEDVKKSIESLLQESGLTLTNLTLYGEKAKTKKPFYAITEAKKY